MAIILSGTDCVAMLLHGGAPALHKLVTSWRRRAPTPDTRVYLIVQGSERAIAQHMRTRKRQQQRAASQAAGAAGGEPSACSSGSAAPELVTPATLQAAFVWVHLRCGVEPKPTSNSEHTCRHLVNLTRGIAEAPYRWVAVSPWCPGEGIGSGAQQLG